MRIKLTSLRPGVWPGSKPKALVVLAMLAVLTGPVLACQVPVFRYALERWSVDRYKILVLAKGVLDSRHQAVFEALKENPSFRARAELELVDVTQAQDASVQELWREHATDAGPLMVALYPPSSSSATPQVASVGPFAEDEIQGLASSPAREQLINRLLEGQSAVWVFLESGNPAKDRAARRILSEQLDHDARRLQLPSAADMEIKPEVLSKTKIKLRVAFSIVDVSRADPQEKFLVSCLLNSESDLRTFDEPLAFPVFGRGRVLYALVGQGISPGTIQAASSFIVGPCSCQVKNQNPGFDLWLTCDWDNAVGNTLISEPLPVTGAQPKLLSIPPGRAAR